MTGIEWTDKTWNPVTGCTKVSPGCRNCYAEGIANRFWGDRSFDQIQFHPERLQQPLKWRKPQRIFVNSMSDLFHPEVTFEQLFEIASAMLATPQHTYQVLTKRPERLPLWVSVIKQLQNVCNGSMVNPPRINPLPNVWLGVSIENQKAADTRIPLLMQTPASVRFLSCEPLLEAVNLDKFLVLENGWHKGNAELVRHMDHICRAWVIAGGESGPGARPCHLPWITSIVEQCKSAKVPCFVKQLGSNPILDVEVSGPSKRGKNNDPAKWPEVIRVQEFP